MSIMSKILPCQRQKKLEAKMIRDQMEEEKRKQIDMEEAKYREEKQKEAIEKAKQQLYYETERVKGLHRALLLTEVLKEREAQIELKQRKKSASKDLDKEFMQKVKAREDEALKKEQERAQQKRQESKAFAQELQKQIKENQLERERRKNETKKDGEEIQWLQELHQWEQKMEEEAQAKQKSDFMQAQLEHLTQRDISRVLDAEKQEAEEAQRKLFLSAKEKMVKLRRAKETELFREIQNRRERLMDKLTLAQKEQKQQSVAKAVAEQDAQRMQQQREEEKKRVEMMRSITAHREHVVKEKERNKLIRKEKERAALLAKKEGDRIFCEEHQKKAQSIRQELQKLQDFNASQMLEKQARQDQVWRAEHEFDAKNMERLAEEEFGFEQYSSAVVQAAATAQRNVLPLYKVVREGAGGGPMYTGARPRYLVQDTSGAEMPKYVSDSTRDIKKIHEVDDIEEGKKRLGFKWL
ncbi:cilia- and flagella- associated protein 210 isoform X2 [Phyllopteryx taeniolatus]|uniref:cilia- and flagella- associated protein 210 isoform X2 n=1 Tax=Phyllopteryx taeniolatus TaxID=161469 RepID=UPI002AD41144|nr:cilia- and flagella- associated protein 210 isoform X2 [Phyllopteryx taeniolatus]XP_061649608.1 cilia- and flagella- associated protein 210 isoform X2 [Phyllopteryx taeniolatus]